MFTNTIKSIALMSVLLLLSANISYASENNENLEALKNAVASKPKASTAKGRSIVFDNESTPATEKASAPADCKDKTNSSATVSVGFAVNFKLGSASISNESEGLLSEIAKVLALNTDKCVLVEGHTDATGDAARNLALSQARADAVVENLVSKGQLNSAYLVAVGKGQNEPLPGISPNNAKNRRVVFKIIP